MRLIIATKNGVLVDREDIVLARLGHAGGARIFEPGSDPCKQHYENCGLEWCTNEGVLDELVAHEMLVEHSDDDVLAVACVLPRPEEPVLNEVEEVTPSAVEQEQNTAALPWPTMLEDNPAIDSKSWWARLLCKRQEAQKIFSVRESLPDDFYPIR